MGAAKFVTGQNDSNGVGRIQSGLVDIYMERSSGIVQVASLVPSTTPPSVIRPSGSLTLKSQHFRGGVSIVPPVDTANWCLVSGCWFNVNFVHLYMYDAGLLLLPSSA